MTRRELFRDKQIPSSALREIISMRTQAGRRQRFSIPNGIEQVRFWVSDIMSIELIIEPIRALAALYLFHALEGSSHNN